jgi:2-oxo-4-hydroxy-4-carboxy-5-ureidoimidazoline decarboxylase
MRRAAARDARSPAQLSFHAMTLDQLNELDAHEFVAALGGVFEHSPWIVERTHASRPFASIDALHRTLVDTIDRASTDEQLALLRAHPELAGKAAIAGTMTSESIDEQSSAGLGACTPEEFARINALNRRYNERFGFPFILAVRGLDRRRIIEAFARRVEHTRDVEFRECLAQVARISRLRLDALLGATDRSS